MIHEEYESKSQMKRVEILKAAEKQIIHEELLAKIDAQIAISYAGSGFSEFASRGTMVEAALRAVVELHKPNEFNLCEICRWYMNKHKYPCPTIQAIEKELK